MHGSELFGPDLDKSALLDIKSFASYPSGILSSGNLQVLITILGLLLLVMQILGFWLGM